MAAPFTELETGINYTIMRDEHELVKIVEKNVLVGDIGKIITGEINSQEIEFSISRYYDNVDLLDKNFYILYETKGGVFKVPAIDIAYNDEEIRFSWLLNEDATMYPGKITASIMIEGEDEHENDYVLKTMNFFINVEEALGEHGADGIYKTWASGIETRVENLERKGYSSSDTFVGTLEEYDAANSLGNIVDGMFVVITDI